MPIKNGKIFQSKPAAFQVIVRGKEPKERDVLGNVFTYYTELVAEFAYHGGDLIFNDPVSGKQDRFADIRGHFFDSAQQAEEKGWTQEEHDAVVRVVERQCKQMPEYVWEVTPRTLPAPWPTYDDTAAGKLATLAESLGLASEALAYEKQNKNRKQVVEDLTAILAAKQPEQPQTAEEIIAA